jgi:uncharacterized protein
MKVSGSAVFHAPPEDVWRALNDPQVLVRTIPGCHRLEEVGPDTYKMTLSAGVASIKGTYDGDVRLTDQQPPSGFVMRASGAGAPGTVQTDVRVTLAEVEPGQTRLDYDADAVVGGMIGGVGQRMLTGVAKKTANEFFRAVDNAITGAAPAAVPAQQAAATAAGPASVTTAERPVFTAPPVAASSSRDFTRGAAFGAAIALAGVVLGWVIGRG